MDPIGASPTWEWHGYRNSYVEIDGRRMQSVSGGSHWGGGVFIHAQDQARIGLMLLRGGVWDGRRILSEDWIARMRVPCPLYPQYGYLWWLNTGRALYPSASEASYCAIGRRRQPDLDRPRQRPRRGHALDRPGGARRLHAAGDGSAIR